MRLFCLLIIFTFVSSCSKKREQDVVWNASPESVAVDSYKALAKGDYERFLAAVNSCDSVSLDYRKRMLTLVKQHSIQMIKDYGKVENITVVEEKIKRKQTNAEVYLLLQYEKGNKEEILVPMVLVNGRWRLK